MAGRKPQTAWHRRYDIFDNRNFRAKRRDTQAVILTRENVEDVAFVCNGRSMETLDSNGTPCVMVRFEGFRGTEFVVEGEYLVRIILPGTEIFTAYNKEGFERSYEKVSWSELNKLRKPRKEAS